MRRFKKKDFKQCELQPVTEELPNSIPGVPLHFNYGVFFDDDYDYMQHLRTVNNSKAYTIAVIHEDKAIETPVMPCSEDIRQPVVDNQEVIRGMYLDSDSESAASEDVLEDNFIELAGGNVTHDVDDTDMNALRDMIYSESKTSNLSEHKMAMMKRFLRGDNSDDESDDYSDGDGEYIYLDKTKVNETTSNYVMSEEELLNKDFEKLLLKFRNRNNCAQSTMSGTSVMSEGLQIALDRDMFMLSRRKMKNDESSSLDVQSKVQLKAIIDECNTDPDLSSSSEDEEHSFSKSQVTNIDSIQSVENASSFGKELVMPRVKNSSRLKKLKPINDQKTTSVKSLDPQLLVRRKGESAEEKHERKKLVKQHRRLRRQIRKTNQENFEQEKSREMKNHARTVLIH